MTALLRLSRGIDRASEIVGRALGWVALVLILVGVANVLLRYIGAQVGAQLSSNALLEVQTQAFDLVFLLGAAYLLRHDGHIRVDIVHARLSARARAWIDIAGTALLLMPLCALVIWLGWGYVARSWAHMEMSPNPYGLPLYPIKTVMLAAFALLLLQGVSEIIKRVAILRAPGDSS